MNEEGINERHRARMLRRKEVIDQKIDAAKRYAGVLVVNTGNFAFIYAANMDCLSMRGARVEFFPRLPTNRFQMMPMQFTCRAATRNCTRKHYHRQRAGGTRFKKPRMQAYPFLPNAAA